MDINWFRPYSQRPFDNQLINKHQLIGVEIGVWRGYHAAEMLMKLNISKLYLIDPYKKYKEYTQKELVNKINEAKICVKKTLKDFQDKIIPIYKMSEIAAKEVSELLDFVYIDGNHEYEFVKKDIESWYPKIKTNGLIGGHDYINDFPGVIKAVDEFCFQNKKILHTEFGINMPNCKGFTRDWWVTK